MACFLVTAAEAVVVTAVAQAIKKNEKKDMSVQLEDQKQIPREFDS